MEFVIIRNAIINSENLDNYHTEAMVEILVQKMNSSRELEE
jgi:hypothetical protein